MIFRSALIAIVCSLALAGCDVETEGYVYLSDILSVAKTGQTEKAKVRYLVEVPTKDKCMLYGQKIVEIMKPQMPEFTGAGCLRRELQDFVVIEGSISLVNGTLTGPDNYRFDYQGVAALGVRVQDDGMAEFDLCLAKSVFESLSNQIKQVLERESFDSHISKIEITLDNDTKADFKVGFSAAFVDGDPVIFGSSTFKSHSKGVIRVSDVHAKALEKTGAIALFVWKSDLERKTN
ncbi:MAG: hypothetical protein JWO19_6040 [Bryobacterales bacterium]|nr:hypothetical protein [Bryobacterales bacterium]